MTRVTSEGMGYKIEIKFLDKKWIPLLLGLNRNLNWFLNF
jgi:hypothetical protein